MKQFAKPFLSIMLLLSVAGICADAGSDEDGSTLLDFDSGDDFGTQVDRESNNSDRAGRRNSDSRGDCSNGHERCSSTLYLPRPQGLNYARFFNPYWYGPDSGDQCGYVDIGYRYRQSLKTKELLNASSAQTI